MDWGLLTGLVAIAAAIFFGLWGFRKGVTDQLSTIKEAVVAIRTTVEKTWDLVLVRFGESHGTVVRELENLGEVKITAEPALNKTLYLIEIEKPIFREGLLTRTFKEPEFVRREKELLGKEGNFWLLSPHRIKYSLPSTDPKNCTEFVTFMLKWLNSTYTKSLDVTEFEKPILT